MRRPETDETWDAHGLVLWIDDPYPWDGPGRQRNIYIPWSEIRSIRKHLQNGGGIRNCPVKASRWAMGEILKDMEDDSN